MKEKWHISKKGIPALCTATVSTCPLGSHYENKELAEKANTQAMSKAYDILPSVDDNIKLNIEEKEKVVNIIKFITTDSSRGYDYECNSTLKLAENMGLKYMSITSKENNIVSMPIDENDNSAVDGGDNVRLCQDILKKYYRKRGFPVRNLSALTKVIYYSDNLDDGILVQSGGSNVLDAAIIKPNSTEIIEIKDLETGAQYPSSNLSVNLDGSINSYNEDSKIYDDKVKEKLSQLNIKDADGSNYPLKFDTKEDNLRIPLKHLVDSYKNKGATSLMYTTNSHETLNKIDFSEDTEKVVDSLISHNIVGQLRLRANSSPTLVNKADLHRLDNLFHDELFKPNTDKDKLYFTLNEVNQDKIEQSTEFVRVGRYVLPIKYKDYKENMNQKIIKRTIKCFDLKLMGDLRLNGNK